MMGMYCKIGFKQQKIKQVIYQTKEKKYYSPRMPIIIKNGYWIICNYCETVLNAVSIITMIKFKYLVSMTVYHVI